MQVRIQKIYGKHYFTSPSISAKHTVAEDSPTQVTLTAGQVLLGGNRGSNGNASMYSLATLKDGTAPVDTTPPSTPAIQTAVADSPTQATLTWSAATDNIGVTGYTRYRDNTPITTTPHLVYIDTTLTASTAYSYFVVAHDGADNDWSAATDNIGVTGYTRYRDNNPLTTTPKPVIRRFQSHALYDLCLFRRGT